MEDTEVGLEETYYDQEKITPNPVGNIIDYTKPLGKCNKDKVTKTSVQTEQVIDGQTVIVLETQTTINSQKLLGSPYDNNSPGTTVEGNGALAAAASNMPLESPNQEQTSSDPNFDGTTNSANNAESETGATNTPLDNILSLENDLKDATAATREEIEKATAEFQQTLEELDRKYNDQVEQIRDEMREAETEKVMKIQESENNLKERIAKAKEKQAQEQKRIEEELLRKEKEEAERKAKEEEEAKHQAHVNLVTRFNDRLTRLNEVREARYKQTEAVSKVLYGVDPKILRNVDDPNIIDSDDPDIVKILHVVDQSGIIQGAYSELIAQSVKIGESASKDSASLDLSSDARLTDNKATNLCLRASLACQTLLDEETISWEDYYICYQKVLESDPCRTARLTNKLL